MSTMLLCPAPVFITVYTRYRHLQQCIEALQKNDLAQKTDLYIFSDAPAKTEHSEDVKKVRAFIQKITGFKSITIEKPKVNSRVEKKDYVLLIQQQLLQKYDKYIFLEDDIIVSQHFLRFMNEALIYFKEDPRIGAISSYSLPIKIPISYKHDIYLGKRFSPWGYAIWKHWFDKIDFSCFDRYSIATQTEHIKNFKSVGADILEILCLDSQGMIYAPDVRFCFHQIMNNLYTVFPSVSLSRNIGLDGSGEHCGINNRFDVTLNNKSEYNIEFTNIQANEKILKRFQQYEDNYIILITPIKRLTAFIILHIKKLLKKLGIFYWLKSFLKGKRAYE